MKLVNVKSPFSNDKEIIDVEFENKPLSEYIPKTETSLIVTVNGETIDKSNYSMIPRPDAFIVIRPEVEGDNILGILAMIALTVFAFTMAPILTGLKAGATWGMATQIAFGAIMGLGGLLLSSLFQPDIPSYDGSSSQTYSWSGMKTLQGQNNPIPITFGTVKTAGQLLAVHITTKDDKQYLNLLLSGGEGELDFIQNVRIDDNPIANYTDVEVYTRLGTNTQTVIPNFSDTYADKELSFSLELDSAKTQQTEGDGGEGLEVAIEFPSGLYYAKDDGSPGETSVGFKLEYRRRTSASGVYPEVYDGWFDWNFSGEQPVLTTNGNLDFSGVGSTTITDVVIFPSLYMIAADYQIRFSASDFYETRDFTLSSSGYQSSVSFSSITLPGEVISYSIYRIPHGTGTISITESSNSAVRKTYRMDNLEKGKYEVRITRISQSGSSARYINKAYWTRLTHILYDDFSFPGIALIGIKALATDQLSGSMPSITWEQGRTNGYVWNPNTEAYEQKPLNNPAWACYDAIHYCRKIENPLTLSYEYIVFGNPYSKIDYDAFVEWADFCTNKDLQCNFLSDAIGEFWDGLKPFEACGRGKVVFKGTKFSCIYDGVKSPVQQFTMGNIIKDSFREEFLPLKDRANSVEVTFFDIEQGYERNTVSVYSSDFDTDSYNSNPAQITLYACTRASQAYREGRYRLNLNKYIIRTINFEADVDSIACQLGDIINFQHDIPQWGYGGRIISAGTDYVILDQDVTLEVGQSYQVQISLSDGTNVTKSVQTVITETTTSILNLTTSFSTIPSSFDVYAFGPSTLSTKPFKVVSISRSSNLRRKIVALEYIEDVYAEDENISTVNYSLLSSDISNLNVSEIVDVNHNVYINIYWTPPKYTYGGAVLTIDGTKHELDMSKSSYSFLSTVDKTYKIEIAAKDIFGVKKNTLTQYYDRITPELYDITNFYVLQYGRRLALSWDIVAGANYYEIRRGSTWESAEKISSVKENYVDVYNAPLGEQTYLIKAFNSNGVIWSNESSYLVDVSNYVPAVTNIEFQEDTFLLKDGTALSNVTISFTPPSYDYIDFYQVYYDINESGAWVYAGNTYESYFILKSLPNTSSVKAKIIIIDKAKISGEELVSSVFYLTGKSNPPSNVSNLTITQSSTNKSVLNISFDKITDIDFKAVEIRIGATWESPSVIVLPLVYGFETTYKISSSGLYTFRARAIDWSNNYSSTEAVSSISIDISPPSVSNFQGSQNGDFVSLIWDEITSADIKYYELREGSSFDNGTLIATGIANTYYEAQVSSERTYNFHIKAINSEKIYSINPSSVAVIVDDLTPLNVLVTYDEIVLQSGTHSNTEFATSSYNCTNFPGLCSDYPTTGCDEVGGGTVLRLSGTNTYGEYASTIKDLGAIILVNIKADFKSTVLFSSNNYAKIQVRTSKDNISWDSWTDYVPVTKNTRYIQFKAILGQEDSNNPLEVGVFSITADVDDKDISGTSSVSSSGSTVSFGYTYNIVPSVVANSIGSGLYAEITDITYTGFTVYVKQVSDDTSVEGNIGWRARGY